MAETSNRKSRRQSGVAGLKLKDFDLDVGARDHPDEKFLSYTKARIKEALMKVRHVDEIEGGDPTEPTVGRNGTVYYNGNKYKIISTCGSNTGSPSINCFKCCTCCKHRPREPSDFENMGVGVVLYFKYLKIMSCAFFLLTMLATVQFIIFENAGAMKEAVEAQGGGLATLSLVSMGNLGEGQTLCEKVTEGETLKLYCNEGQVIGGISKVLYGQPTGSCECPQRGSEDEEIYYASVPPSLLDPTRCAVDYPYNGITEVTKERCCSKEFLPSGMGDLTSLNFRSKEKCLSDIRVTRNTTSSQSSDNTCGGDVVADESGRNTFAWDIVFNACNGKPNCDVLVSDFTQWDTNKNSLSECQSSAASDCPLAFGSLDKVTRDKNESTFTNCTSTRMKSLAVVATCFDTTTEIMGEKTTKDELWIYCKFLPNRSISYSLFLTHSLTN